LNGEDVFEVGLSKVEGLLIGDDFGVFERRSSNSLSIFNFENNSDWLKNKTVKF
jgi:hypothetical protein